MLCHIPTFYFPSFELMETVMFNNHNSNIFCPLHTSWGNWKTFLLFSKHCNLSFCSAAFSTYQSFEQLEKLLCMCVGKVSISPMSPSSGVEAPMVLSTLSEKQNKHCELKMEICSQNNNSETYICTLLKGEAYMEGCCCYCCFCCCGCCCCCS